jgi:DHA2 family multidrug resistance protein
VNPWLVTVSVMLPTFMEVLDTAIASVALPYIAGSLSASNSEATWVLTSYLVANAVILPASNWFARRFGRKRFPAHLRHPSSPSPRSSAARRPRWASFCWPA